MGDAEPDDCEIENATLLSCSHSIFGDSTTLDAAFADVYVSFRDPKPQDSRGRSSAESSAISAVIGRITSFKVWVGKAMVKYT